jgi:hypothetical protein
MGLHDPGQEAQSASIHFYSRPIEPVVFVLETRDYLNAVPATKANQLPLPRWKAYYPTLLWGR